MLKKNIQMSKYAMLMIGISIVSGQNVYADGFYTIIGPDGRPMIVPKRIPHNNFNLRLEILRKNRPYPIKLLKIKSKRQ
jgi:hypothetical protein